MNSTYSGQPMVSLNMINGQLKFVVTRYNNSMYNYKVQAFAHPSLTDGKWHHIVLLSDFVSQIAHSLLIHSTWTVKKFIVSQKALILGLVHTETEPPLLWVVILNSITTRLVALI